MIKDDVKRREYFVNYNQKKYIKSGVFFPGQIVRVCGSQEGRTGRIGMKCRIVRKGLGNQYWVKFENEPEMIFRGAWLERLNDE